MTDVRFPTALQIMLSLALAHEEGVPMLTSSQLAVGVGSVASLVRKLLAQLAKDGLVTGVAGRSGGVRLARPASAITLAEIYRSVMQGGPLWSARKDIPHRCIVSTHMDDFFSELTSDAETAMLVSLSSKTLASSLRKMRAVDRETSAPKRRAASRTKGIANTGRSTH
jgi:Rrf2 family transcriptional regulator, repressor of oqxAB